MKNVILVPAIDTLSQVNLTAYNTVEAEYGTTVIEGIGGGVTLAHHGNRSNNPAPCIAEVVPNDLPIIVSHIDLDTIGGIMSLWGLNNDPGDSFWRLAAYVDVYGIHRINDAKAPDGAISRLYAYQAWASSHRAPRVSEATDVTDYIQSAIAVIREIQAGNPALFIAGEKWRQDTEAATEACLISEDSNVRVFVTDGVFCGASYWSPTLQTVAKATVTLNTRFGACTVAFEDGGQMHDAVKIVQSLWGGEAGGRRGIAGSPRGKTMTRDDLDMLVERVKGLYQ